MQSYFECSENCREYISLKAFVFRDAPWVVRTWIMIQKTHVFECIIFRTSWLHWVNQHPCSWHAAHNKVCPGVSVTAILVPYIFSWYPIRLSRLGNSYGDGTSVDELHLLNNMVEYQDSSPRNIGNLGNMPLQWVPGPRFNIKMPSYQYRKSHCGDKTVVRSSYLHSGISYTGKKTSLYWFSPQSFQWKWTTKRNISLKDLAFKLPICLGNSLVIISAWLERNHLSLTFSRGWWWWGWGWNGLGVVVSCPIDQYISHKAYFIDFVSYCT